MANQTLNNGRQKIAVLIDGDNAQSSLLPQMLVEAGRHGQVTVRRIYGDWTTQNMNSWKETLNYHAFQPIQQFRYTIGKNATDSAMIIDAMDLLHSGVVDGFCLVSSDSDYTRLATRIRETGIFVMGNAIYQVDPGCDPRTYGHKQLSRMLNKLKDKVEMRTQDIEGQLIFYVRMKE